MAAILENVGHKVVIIDAAAEKLASNKVIPIPLNNCVLNIFRSAYRLDFHLV